MNLLSKLRGYISLILLIIVICIHISYYPIYVNFLESLPKFSKPPGLSINTKNPWEKFMTPLDQLSGKFGYIDYAPVVIDGSPIFDIGVSNLKSPSTKGETLSPLKQRIGFFEDSLKDIIKNGYDLKTLSVRIGTLNHNLVIEVSDKNTSSPIIIGTISHADSYIYGETIQQTGERESRLIYELLIKSFQERQATNLKSKVKMIIFIILDTILICFLLIKLIIIIKNRRKKFAKILFSVDNEESINEGESLVFSFLKYRDVFLYNFINYLFDCISYLPYYIKSRSLLIKNKIKYISLKRFINNPKNYLTKDQYERLLHSQEKFEVTIERVITLTIVFGVYACIHLSLFVFPDTRLLGVKFNGIPFSLFRIWLATIIIINILERFLSWFLENSIDNYFSGKESLARKFKQISILINPIKILISLPIFLVAIVFTLDTFNIPTGSLLASASFLGFIITFSFQNIIKDIIAAVMNILHDSYAINDFVTLDSYEGYVESISPFMTQIRTENGNLVTIPSSMVGKVCNHSKEYSEAILELKISPKADLNIVFEVIDQVTTSLYNDSQWHDLLLESTCLKSLKSISNDQTILNISLKIVPRKESTVSSYLILKIKEEFSKSDIELA